MTKFSSNYSNVQDDFKDSSSTFNKQNHSKFEYDLFDEEKAAQIEDVITVKRISLPNNGVNWKIMKNNKLVFLVEGAKLSKKERGYLSGVDGFKFLMAQQKEGIKSLNSLRTELKKIVD